MRGSGGARPYGKSRIPCTVSRSHRHRGNAQPMSVFIEQSSQGLRVTSRLASAWVISLSGAALLLFWSFSSWVRVEGKRRPDGKVDAQVQTLRLGCRSAAWEVKDLRAARLETELGGSRMHQHVGSRSGRDGPTHRVVLVDGMGREYPLSRYRSSSAGAHAQAASQIQQFLSTPQLDRWVAVKPWEPATLWFLIFALLPPLAAALGRASITLRTGQEQVEITAPGLLGSRRQTMPLSEIQEFRAIHGKSRQHKAAPLLPAVVLRNGKTLRIDSFWFASDEEVITAVSVLERQRSALELHATRRGQSR